MGSWSNVFRGNYLHKDFKFVDQTVRYRLYCIYESFFKEICSIPNRSPPKKQQLEFDQSLKICYLLFLIFSQVWENKIHLEAH